MARSKAESLPAGSVHELVEFFDTHDMGDDWDQMPEVHFDVDIERRAHLVTLDEDLVSKITEVARARHVSSESLINSLLREKLAEATQ